jgi:hypothetical protein
MHAWSSEEVHYFGKRKEIVIRTSHRLNGNKFEFRSKAENVVNSDYVSWGKICFDKFESIHEAKKRIGLHT